MPQFDFALIKGVVDSCKNGLSSYDIALKLTGTFIGMTMEQAQDYVCLCALYDSLVN